MLFINCLCSKEGATIVAHLLFFGALYTSFFVRYRSTYHSKGVRLIIKTLSPFLLILLAGGLSLLFVKGLGLNLVLRRMQEKQELLGLIRVLFLVRVVLFNINKRIKLLFSHIGWKPNCKREVFLNTLYYFTLTGFTLIACLFLREGVIVEVCPPLRAKIRGGSRSY